VDGGVEVLGYFALAGVFCISSSIEMVGFFEFAAGHASGTSLVVEAAGSAEYWEESSVDGVG